MKKLLLLLVLLLSTQAQAQAFCFREAGVRYKVDQWLLRAIQFTENQLGDPGKINYNKDGSRDIGLMQINSSWLPKLEKLGITEKELLDPCVNINIGAWILAENVAVYGHTWKAVGAYNSPTLDNQRIYIRKVMNNYGVNAR